MRDGIVVPAWKKKKKKGGPLNLEFSWPSKSFFFTSAFIFALSLNAHPSLHSSSGCISHSCRAGKICQKQKWFLQGLWTPLLMAGAGKGTMSGCSERSNWQALVQGNLHCPGPHAHSLAVRSPSYRPGCGTRRSRTIRLGYRARRDSDLAHLQFSISWLAATSSVSRDLGTWTKDLDSTFCRTTSGSGPEERKQKVSLLAVRILCIPILR